MPTLPRTADGRIALPGRVSHVVEHDFGWGGSLPTGFVTGGTVAVEGGNGIGTLRLTIASAQARIELPTQVDVSSDKVRAVVWSILGTRYPTAGWPGDMFLALEGSGTIGGNWRRTNLTLNGRTGDPSVSAPVTTSYGGREGSTSLSLVMLPRTKQLALLSGDQVINMGDFPNLDVSGLVVPKVVVSGSAGNTVAISKLRLEVRTD